MLNRCSRIMKGIIVPLTTMTNFLDPNMNQTMVKIANKNARGSTVQDLCRI